MDNCTATQRVTCLSDFVTAYCPRRSSELVPDCAGWHATGVQRVGPVAARLIRTRPRFQRRPCLSGLSGRQVPDQQLTRPKEKKAKQAGHKRQSTARCRVEAGRSSQRTIGKKKKGEKNESEEREEKKKKEKGTKNKNNDYDHCRRRREYLSYLLSPSPPCPAGLTDPCHADDGQAGWVLHGVRAQHATDRRTGRLRRMDKKHQQQAAFKVSLTRRGRTGHRKRGRDDLVGGYLITTG